MTLLLRMFKLNLTAKALAFSHVSIQLKINRAVEQGSIQRVGTVKHRMGRPTVVYRRTKAQS